VGRAGKEGGRGREAEQRGPALSVARSNRREPSGDVGKALSEAGGIAGRKQPAWLTAAAGRKAEKPLVLSTIKRRRRPLVVPSALSHSSALSLSSI